MLVSVFYSLIAFLIAVFKDEFSLIKSIIVSGYIHVLLDISNIFSFDTFSSKNISGNNLLNSSRYLKRASVYSFLIKSSLDNKQKYLLSSIFIEAIGVE